MNNLEWTVSQTNPEQKLVLLKGVITEDVDFKPLISLAGQGGLAFDLAGVEQINSCGVREWIHFVRKLADVGSEFEMLRCSPAIVRQLNTIANFRGTGQVRSVMLPYFCTSCRTEEQRPLDLGGDRDIEDEITCPKCGGVMEFDDMPDTYISFCG